ncbi:hypothetical protein PLESTB_000154100 [Pleodorina starrii]|uniref:Uncharacterized protein n=1 Tax=Pleodorina starrii TaxID=330485 RepID=A0A9W6EXV7_9CHLO|nr:hypothetical protein PLESTM_000452800 [Pleodorina starrii]GLC48839.1 hypothetical protein PLESTB_000154100 [Pleodorina starrii]GLC72577.1 hypothetical protein PLESTF_001266500 [Pleodorina starrii]
MVAGCGGWGTGKDVEPLGANAHMRGFGGPDSDDGFDSSGRVMGGVDQAATMAGNAEVVARHQGREGETFGRGGGRQGGGRLADPECGARSATEWMGRACL